MLQTLTLLPCFCYKPAMRVIRSASRLCWLLLAGLLSACAGGGHGAPLASDGGAVYPGINCAPFARELSGIALYGDAASWWDQAAGHYVRASRPRLGSALVLRREPRLPSGHVSVVSRILGPRQIQVTQANWVAGELALDQLVVDVSERNDWTEVRVWWPPIGQLGSHPYPAYGFIEAPGTASHEELVNTAPTAARLALTSNVGRPPPRARLMASGAL
jgi:surface antigen